MRNVKYSPHNVPLQVLNVLPSLLVPKLPFSKAVMSALMVFVDGCLVKNVRNSKLVRMQMVLIILHVQCMEVNVLLMVPNVSIRVYVKLI